MARRYNGSSQRGVTRAASTPIARRHNELEHQPWSGVLNYALCRWGDLEHPLLLAEFQMEGRIRSPISIELIASHLPESSTEVEAAGSGILFIHVDSGHSEFGDGLIEQLRTDTLSTGIVGHEKHFKISFSDPGETDRPSGSFGDDQAHGRQIGRCKIALDPIEVRLLEKVVRRAHGAAPNFNEGRILGRATRSADFKSLFILDVTILAGCTLPNQPRSALRESSLPRPGGAAITRAACSARCDPAARANGPPGRPRARRSQPRSYGIIHVRFERLMA